MKRTLIASALIGLSMAASGSAFAQRGDHGNERVDHDRKGRAEQRHDGPYDSGRYDRHDNGRYDNERNARHDRNGRFERNVRHDRYYDAQHFRRDDWRGGGPRHDLRRGQRLHQEYRGQRYIVSDWRERHLSAPPRDHHWVRAGNDYVLAAIATGLIAQVLLSN